MSWKAEHKHVIALYVIQILTVGWGIYWLIIAAYYSVPNVEDFSLAIRPRDQGLIPSVINLLVSYDSRYTDAFLHGLNPLAFNWVEWFIVMPILCFIFFVVSLYYFLSAFITDKGIRFQLLGYALLFVVIHYAMETQLPCGLYLMVSTFNYIYPWFFAFIWSGALLRTIHETSVTKKILLSILGYFALILSYGCTEFFISINGFALIALFLYTAVYDQSKLKYVIPYCLVAISCVVFIFLCPSQKIINDKPFYDLAERYPNSNFIIESTKIYIRFTWECLLHPLSICFVLVTTFFFSRIDMPGNMKFRVSQRQLLWLFIGCIIVSYVTSWIFFIPIGSTGIFPRYTFNSLLILAELGFFVFLPLYLKQPLAMFATNYSFRFAHPLAATLLLLLLLHTDNNITLVEQEYDAGIIQDVKYKAQQFYSRVQLAKLQTPEHTVVYFENPAITPQTNYFGPDMLPNRGAPHWNIAYEDYFHIDEVRMPGDTLFK